MKAASNPALATKLPARPGFGTKGRPIKLRANFFKVEVPSVDIHHYDVTLSPGACPPRVNRAVIIALVDANLSKVFQNKRPVFDGKKNLYSIAALPFGKEKCDFEIGIKEPHDERERPFKVSLKWAAQVNMYELQEALKGTMAMPLSAIQSLDVVMRQLPSMRCVPVGRSFFTAPQDRQATVVLGDGREIWFGYHQSVRPSQWKMLVNIDVSATAFYTAQPVLRFLSEIIREDVTVNKQPLKDYDRVKFAKEIKGLRVEVTHMGTQRRKQRVINVTKLPANKLKFPFEKDGETTDVTVESYFQETYKKRLQFPHLPCLQVGQEARHTYLPIEVCHLVAGQRCIKKLSDVQTANMIKATAKEAPLREREINKLANQANFKDDIYLKTFGMRVNTKMVEMDGRVLNPPAIEYKEPGKHGVVPREGKWDMRSKKFVTGIKVQVWALLVMGSPRQCSESDLKQFARQLAEVSGNMGMPFAEGAVFCKYFSRVDMVQSLFEQIKRDPKKIQLVMVVLPGKTPVYAEIKQMGDREYSIPTQCVQIKNVKKNSPQTLGNLCLKINTKLGGTNCRIMKPDKPAVFNKPVIFLGADVTHPSPGDDTRPSIAAVVGSLDSGPNQYQAAVRVQKHRQEIIQDLKVMVCELLRAFKEKTHHEPSHIIMYRDGVSEGQFQQVLQFELNALQQACMSLSTTYRPQITFIIVQKRHHARFFAVNKNDQIGKSCNIPAGTTVDTAVCHPSEFDFYLCSHAGIQGTSRPAHYHVLYDDHDFSADQLQQLSFYLCHTYIRCTRSVSIPAPAYYAHLVAFRARYHLTDKNSCDSSSQASGNEAEQTPKRMAEAVNLPVAMQRSMYFT